jgi:tetratricopeptide (TPR) repeat protein
MRGILSPRHLIGFWVAWLSVSGCLLGAFLPDAHARAYKRREREKYECRPSQEPASADIDKAQRLWESGMIYYDAKDYQKSRADFQSAYDISHLPDFLINLAQVTAKLELFNEAIKFLEAYIQECPGAPDVPLASQRIEELRIDQGMREGEKPRPKPVHLPPKGALALMGTGAVLLVVGLGLGGGAILAAHQVSNPANQNMFFSPALQQAEVQGQQLQNAGIACDVLGALALIPGAIWAGAWLYEQKTGMSLTLAPRMGGLVLTGGF